MILLTLLVHKGWKNQTIVAKCWGLAVAEGKLQCCSPVRLSVCWTGICDSGESRINSVTQYSKCCARQASGRGPQSTGGTRERERERGVSTGGRAAGPGHGRPHQLFQHLLPLHTRAVQQSGCTNILKQLTTGCSTSSPFDKQGEVDGRLLIKWTPCNIVLFRMDSFSFLILPPSSFNFRGSAYKENVIWICRWFSWKYEKYKFNWLCIEKYHLLIQ